MIRKLFLFAAILLSLGYVKAQSVGEWKIWSQFSGQIDNIVETPAKVYYTSANRLFSYDKESNESYSYNTQNKLNDLNVDLIAYNPSGKYVIVAYDNGNLDLLFDNGRVVNMSDIKDATMSYSRKINNITFANGRIYLATDFGLVVIDDKKYEVVESGIYGVPLSSVVPVADFMIISRPGNGFWYAPLNNRHNTLDKFTKMPIGQDVKWADVVGDNIFFQEVSYGDGLKRIKVENQNGMPMTHYSDIDAVPISRLKKSGNLNYIISSTQIGTIDENGNVDFINLPDALKGQDIATINGLKSLWGADSKGVGQYAINDDGTVSVLSDKVQPEGIFTDMVHFIRIDNWGNVWTGNLGPTNYRREVGTDAADIPQAITRIYQGKPQDVSFKLKNGTHEWTPYYQRILSTEKGLSCGQFIPDIENPNRYYQGFNLEGIFIIEKDENSGEWKEIARYHQYNSPIIGIGEWGSRGMAVKFDHEGNLWVGIWANPNQNSAFYVLPKETLRKKEVDKFEYNDWIPTQHLQHGLIGNKDMDFLITKNSKVMFDYGSTADGPMTVTKLKGTLTNTADDEIFQFIDPVDQDGNKWVPVYITSIIEDQRGRVWVGSSDKGVIEIAEPEKLTPDSRVNHLKVPRNDGTDYADYLLGSDFIFDMAVDPSNRKWIATKTSGVYLVSENGDKIIEHFTPANSPLPSNEVLSVTCDPNSNTVYFGLRSGLVSYNSTSSPAAEDYSEVYAFPNPVRPDYTGYITITGLMDNSLVKIADAAGNVVFQTRSEGGTAIWDGMDEAHNRVKTGVYYVLATQNPEGGSEGVVTKIMIVR